MAGVVAPFQPTLFSALYIFQRAATADVVVLMGSAQFTAKSPGEDGTKKFTGQRHTRVGGLLEPAWLPVPIKKEMLPLDETPLPSNPEWRERFMAELFVRYGHEPYWDAFEAPITSVLNQQTLGLLNAESFRWAHRLLELDSVVLHDTACCDKATKGDWVLDMVRGADGDVLLTGRPSLSYMDLAMFNAAGVDVRVQDWECVIPESATLSVLDALFKYGPTKTRALLA